MENFEYIAPCHFGLEAVLKREIADLGGNIVSVDDGRVVFSGNESLGAAANICLRTAERVLLKVGEFEARTYDELFEGTKALPLENFLPRDAKFWVTKASSVKSALFSPSDIHSIKKDLVTVGIDMSGASLHKRGYRVSPVIAPISETLAASLIKLTPWRRGRILVDPFCGSGTFLIEAAMMAANIAPGLKREFTAESWNGIIHAKAFREARRAAQEAILPDIGEGTDLQGFDIDPGAVRHARDNARAAGVEKYIHFQQRDVKQLSHPKKYGFLITNPPYGERIEDKGQVHALYETLGENYRKLQEPQDLQRHDEDLLL